MRTTAIAMLCLAAMPLLVACGSDVSGADDGTQEPGLTKKPADSDPGSADGSGTGAGTDPGATGLAACISQSACDGAGGPSLGDKRAFHKVLNNLLAATGSPNHRGRDQMYTAGDPQWLIGKFTYTSVDSDLKGEDVDIYVERGCGGTWELLGTATTTEDGAHAPVENAEDTGGRVYFQIPKAKELAVGRHRVRMVVGGDLTSTDLLIDIVPKDTPIVISDVDGTLTSGEVAEYGALLQGELPAPQPKAADTLTSLASKGYRPVYLTARPEWLTKRTREFLKKGGFPPGIIVTTSGLTGAIGDSAAQFKITELTRIKSHGAMIAWAFGNQPTDGTAYEAAKIMPADHRVLLQTDDTHGARRIENYGDVLPVVMALPAICK